MEEADVVLLGLGGAGTAALHQLALALLRRTDAAPSPRRPLRVVAVDPVDRLTDRPADRTWCSWVARGSREQVELAPAVHRSWRTVHLVDAGGTDHALDLGALRYAMVRGEDWYAHVAAAVAGPRSRGMLELEHLPVTASAVLEEAGGVRVATPVGEVTASCVLDSRPAPPRRPGASTLVQHFLGERVRTPTAGVDPDRAVLMDFTVPQPASGLAFGYCLPTDSTTALVEHTSFVPAPLDPRVQERALASYRRAALGTDDGAVEHSETGAIPMTDAPFAGRAPAPPGARRSRVLRLGTAGGAVRPSTGYAFSAMQRTARALAPQLVAGVPGGAVELPRPYPRRHAWMDALVLRALLAGPAGPTSGGLDGPAFFTRLFTANPPERVLRFLDGLTPPGQELALMATAPRGPMLRAVVADATWRARLLAGAPASAGRGRRR